MHEDSLFGSGLAKLLNAQLPPKGFQILETIPHPTPTRDFNNVVLKIKAQNPDLVIPADYYNEYVLLARTMLEQHVRPKGIYSVLGGAASSYKFVKDFPDAAKYIMDCNHWFNPKSAKALELKKKVEDKGQFFTYELYMNYTAVQLVADALERAASADRAKLTAALANSTFSGHIMPYGPTKFVNGQNQGAAPVNTQVLDNDIKVILPPRVRQRQGGLPDAGVRYEHIVIASEAKQLFRRGACHRAATSGRIVGSSHDECMTRVRAFTRHPHHRGPQRADDRRRLCAGRAGADADLWRAAHHQFRAWCAC